jgi:hypothetical protein
MVRGRDATDVALSTTFGACTQAGFTVITEKIAGQTWAWRRLFHSSG